MPERIVGMLTGDMPEPILVIPLETWKTFELEGEEDEYIITDIISAWKRAEEKIMDICGEDVKCKTKSYINKIGGKGTGVLIPKVITQKHGIRKNHYLEVLLKEVEKAGQTTEIFPGKEITDNCPYWWKKRVSRER